LGKARKTEAHMGGRIAIETQQLAHDRLCGAGSIRCAVRTRAFRPWPSCRAGCR
jgi:hypothetical protein